MAEGATKLGQGRSDDSHGGSGGGGGQLENFVETLSHCETVSGNAGGVVRLPNNTNFSSDLITNHKTVHESDVKP